MDASAPFSPPIADAKMLLTYIYSLDRVEGPPLTARHERHDRLQKASFNSQNSCPAISKLRRRTLPTSTR
jgi:hypothetical protein